MKKLLAVIIGLALPFSAFAATTIPWVIPTGSSGFIQPQTFNGTNLGLLTLASTTLQNFTGRNATTSQATTTNFAISSLLNCNTTSALTTNATGGFQCGAISGGSSFPFTPQTWGVSTTTTVGFFNGLLSNASSTFNANVYVMSGGLVGIGTTTPQWPLQVLSTTLPQLTLTDGLDSQHWSFRNAGGRFYLATSSIATFATSTIPALSIINGGIAGNVGIGTSTPQTSLQVATSSSRINTQWAALHVGDLGFNSPASQGTFIGANAYAGFTGNFLGFQTGGASRLTLTGAGDLTVAARVSAGTTGFVAGGSGTYAMENTNGFSSANGLVLNFNAFRLGTSTPITTNGLGQMVTLIASSTRAQLTLSDATAGDKLWSFRNAGGLLYLATTSDTTYATSTTAALTIDGNAKTILSGGLQINSLTGPLRADSGTVSVDSTILSGTYTPTATNVTNITSSTPNNNTYTRIGNRVTVFGTITVTNTLAVASEVDVSLPVASNLGAATDLNGTATMDSTASVNLYIKGDATNDRASIFFTSAGVGQTSTIYYSFQYSVI